MNAIRSFLLLMYRNTLGLPLGIKMLAFASALVYALTRFGFSHSSAWALSLAVVILCACLVLKFPKLIGNSNE